MKDAVLVDVVRTASGKGKPGGALSAVHPVDLLATVLQALVERNGLDPVLVDDVIGGCVSQTDEQALNITRTALLAAGYPESVPATTIDRQCGSGQQAAHFAAQGVLAGAYDIAIACGVESMSRVPMFSNARRADTSGKLLSRRYPEGLIPQGLSAELIAARWKLDREELDAFAARSHQRAAATAESGGFDREIVPVGEHVVDETVRPATTPEGLAALKPAFTEVPAAERFPEIGWRITPGNSSPLTDGASAALIMNAATAERLGLRPRARFHSFAVTGSDPLLMLTGVVPATQKVLARSGLTIDDIDAYEVNEAFASVPLLWQRDVGADPQKLNPRGGAIALGHPLGASGTRLLTTLVNHLEATGGRYGLQTMCEGGGMANATVVERI
ncbi:thiolase family protein [Streptomyces cadmiisoli]|uniref:Steroid 3-ketoacyl-CoA thiolase n=1 Tax=Streptomyces cadmiisoli TaxID=2184053 RepID=A0A2Z4ISN3_9ACTN|nr:thiolase family protein [Streptomyces cadmiisoli]AWW35546.1 steroid 3-ketoacyl-CoA thiolase [Streptomyces cadmiisoli]